MLCLYRGGKADDVHFEVLAETIQIDRRQRATTVQRYVLRLEHYCQQALFCQQARYNWFNFYDFWGNEP
jgi:predicted LPLAT superfamily acyltransferase